MTVHQRTQGYAPSLQSMFVQSPKPPPSSPALELNLEPGSLYSHPLPAPSKPYTQPTQRPFSFQPQSIMQQPWHPKPPVPRHPSLPPQPEPPVIKASEVPPAELRSLRTELKTVTFPREVLPRFVSIAAYNTANNRETCGLLLGRMKKSGKYVVTTLLIPKQHATSDTCAMDEENLVVDFQIKRDLITLGWVSF